MDLDVTENVGAWPTDPPCGAAWAAPIANIGIASAKAKVADKAHPDEGFINYSIDEVASSALIYCLLTESGRRGLTSIRKVEETHAKAPGPRPLDWPYRVAAIVSFSRALWLAAVWRCPAGQENWLTPSIINEEANRGKPNDHSNCSTG